MFSFKSFLRPKNKKTTKQIIKEIHESFDTASEKLLNDAKLILEGSYDIQNGERLKNVGFTSAKKAVESEKIIIKKNKKIKILNLVNYYKIYYPNNKFITWDIVDEICKKYNLVCHEISYYTSDVPEKNLLEIEKFKLKECDFEKINYSWWGFGYNKNRDSIIWPSIKAKKTKYGYFKKNVFYEMGEEKTFHYEAPELKICAPVKDFDLKKIKKDYIFKVEIPDPIVLQPVNGGYLVVTKWGLESEDEELINENMN